MIVGHFYMHRNALDICIQVEQAGEARLHPSKNLKSCPVWGKWFNLGYMGQPWLLQDAQIWINQQNLKDWVDITAFINRKRTRGGLPV